ncbi:MFS transporter [Thiotrichales bacterium 19S9-12]|nr:MFS transporter [Thiotrichales bacterium 19S9-11]MCF6811542.1 MFS transporter [Thiotrichales bacterium 19S9-12]
MSNNSSTHLNQASLDNTKLSRHHLKIWFLSAMGVFMDGFDLFIIAVALPLIQQQWQIGAAEAGLIAAAAPVGAILGAGVFGRFTDKMGRRTMLILSVMFFVVFTSLSAFAWGPISLMVFRFLLGIGIGADYPTGSTYVSETMPSHLRGKMMVASFSFQAIGALIGAALGLVILQNDPTLDAWRWMLGAGVIPAILVLWLRMSLPESPRWLMAKGKTEKAKKIAAELTGNIDIDINQIDEPIKTSYKDLFKKKLIRQTTLASIPWFLMDISLYGVGLFTPVILAQMIATEGSDFISKGIAAAEGSIYTYLFFVIGCVVCFFLIERWGRLRLQKIGFIGMTIGLCVLGISTYVSDQTTLMISLNGYDLVIGNLQLILLFSGFIFFYFMINMGPNPTTYLLASEVFPTNVRATGHGFASCMGKVGAAVGIFFLPIMKDSLGLGTTMFIIAASAFLGFLFTLWFGIDTRGSLDHKEKKVNDKKIIPFRSVA